MAPFRAAAPGGVLAATQEYRAGEDVIGAFLDERCVRDPGGRVVAPGLHRAFQDWAKNAGEQPLSARAFGAALKERGIDRTKSNGRDWFEGLSLRERGPDAD